MSLSQKIALLNTRNVLRNNINKHKLAMLGMESQYLPIINKLEELKETMLAIELPNGKTLEIEQPKLEYQISDNDKILWEKIKNMKKGKKENGTLRFSEVRGENRIYQIGDRLLAINNNLFLTNIDGSQLKLNEGLIELFFNPTPNPDLYNNDDVAIYKEFINDLGLKLNENTTKQSSIKSGKGFNLQERLQVLFAANQEGHNNVFNEANEILKVLLSMKKISKEEYKTYLNKWKKK